MLNADNLVYFSDDGQERVIAVESVSDFGKGEIMLSSYGCSCCSYDFYADDTADPVVLRKVLEHSAKVHLEHAKRALKMLGAFDAGGFEGLYRFLSRKDDE